MVILWRIFSVLNNLQCAFVISTIHFVGDCSKGVLFYVSDVLQSSLHLKGCGISGHIICTVSLWGTPPYGVPHSGCVTTVAPET